MKIDTKDDEILKQYLLGALGEEQADELERRLLQEEELFELAEAIEGDLLMAAARGDLSPAERGRVLRRLAASPEGRARLALIRGLTSPSREQVPVPPAVEFPFLERPWVHAAAVAACLAVFVTGSFWLSTQTSIPDTATIISESLPAEPASGTPSPAPVEPPVVEQIAEHPPAPTPSAPQTSVRPKLAPLIFQLALSNVVRSADGDVPRPRLEIPRGTGRVEIQILLQEGEPYKAFSASLQNWFTGKEVLREEQTTAQDVGDGMAVVLSVPSSKLKPGIYEIQLHASAPEGGGLVGQQEFEVVST